MKRRNSILLLAASVLLVLASCSKKVKEPTDNGDSGGTGTTDPTVPASVSVSVLPVSGAAGAQTAVWSEDDQIAVHFKSDALHKYISAEDGFAYRSTHTDKSVDFQSNYALYPYAFSSRISKDGIMTSEIANSQTWREDDVPAGLPLVAVSDSYEFALRNIAAFLRFNVTKSDDFMGTCELEKIRISSSSKVIAGGIQADVTKDDILVSSSGKSESKLVTLTIEEPVMIASQAEQFCVAVLPDTYPAESLTMTFVYNSGLTKTYVYPQELVLTSNTIADVDYTMSPATATGTLIEVGIDCDDADQTKVVSEMIFGSFSEMHGGDLVPGILEQYIVNTSFETWNDDGEGGESKNELVFTKDQAVAAVDGVAYPWQAAVVSGSPTISVSSNVSAGNVFNTSKSQRVKVPNADDAAVLYQRLALPMYRTDKYKLKFYAKNNSTNIPTVKVCFHGEGAKEDEVLSDVYTLDVAADNEFHEYSYEFTLKSSTNKFNNRHTKYNLWIEVTGKGDMFFDHVTLFPSDCIDGMFNPETVEYFKKYNVRSIRWPGGNYTSGYNWKNGIGDWTERPCLYNKAWGGLDSNLLGTDEIARFCELTGAELIMGVGYNPDIIPESDIVDWVKYCKTNRYNVKYWGIGNEVYGSYQLGHTDAATYASGLKSISSKIKAVDSDIVVIASGRGMHNQYRGAYTGWTETVYSSAKSAFDIFDCHAYVYGYEEDKYPAPQSFTGDEYFRIYAAASHNLKDFISFIRKNASGKKLAFLEWAVLPKLSGDSYPTPQRQTFANTLLTACQYHEMIRNCDIVALSALHNFSFYVAPQRLHSEPINIRTILFREFAQVAGGTYVPIDDSTVPTYDQTYNMVDVGKREDVKELDIVAVLKGKYLYVSCVNRNTSESYPLGLDIKGTAIRSMSGNVYTSTQPYVRSTWSRQVSGQLSQIDVQEDGTVIIPPLSYTMITIELDKDDVSDGGAALLKSYVANGSALDMLL